MSKLTNIYLISSLGTYLNKGVPEDLPFLPFAFFWAFAGEERALRCKQRGKVRISTRGRSRGRRGFRPLRRFG